MSFDTDRLYSLLPAVYRARDAEQGGPLRALLSVVADQVGVLEADLDQLLDDQFVETCQPWVLAYLADLIGLRGVRGPGQQQLNSRAEVGNTIRYRRRKGTAAVLEQLAADVTGWPARAVEFFQILATTQYTNHVRAANKSFAPVRSARRLESVNGPFEHLAGEDDIAHTADVRLVGSGRGRYNLPNVGLFLWRLKACPVTASPAVPAAPGDKRRFYFSPLGNNVPLFNLPATEDEFTHLAEPRNVPGRITRRALDRDLTDYYGRSLFVNDGKGQWGPDRVKACDLRDHNGTWAHLPADGIAIDPELGRVAFPTDQDPPPLVTFHTGFSADIGGGEYPRAASFTPGPVVPVGGQPNALAVALAALGASGGVIEITDNGRYDAPTATSLTAAVEIRAAEKTRPVVVLDAPWIVTGTAGASLTLNGLLLTGARVETKELDGLRVLHCTLVPGLSLTSDNQPAQPDAPSLVVGGKTRAEIDHTIIGGVRTDPDVTLHLNRTILDATDESGVACAGLDHASPAGTLRAVACTVIGKVNVSAIDLASDTIFLARLAPADAWEKPVSVVRRQEGCVRFCYVPLGSSVPRRYHCQPAPGTDPVVVRPVPASARYGTPAYCQLGGRTAAQILGGADDEAEMGAFHDLYQPQRVAHLRARLDEYLRVGLEAGVFFVT